MDDATVERVAIAIWNDLHPDTAWLIAACDIQADYRGHARAAIEAMGRPATAAPITPEDALAVLVALAYTGTTHNVSIAGLCALAAVAGRK
jgi:hypothetical protein